MGEGTGGLVLDDDLINIETKHFGGLFGFGGIFWSSDNADRLDFRGQRKPLYYMTSDYELFKGVKYLIDVGTRNDEWGGLVAFATDHETTSLRINSRLQARKYENGFGDEFVGIIEQMYISYDQYDKRYTNAGNIFAFDDDVTVYSLSLNLTYKINDSFELHSNNEVGTFNFNSMEDDEFYFYRVGASYYPLQGRQESITLFASNKVLTDSYMRPPSDYSRTNMPLFTDYDFVGFEASFRF